jgi:hypothetical protein
MHPVQAGIKEAVGTFHTHNTIIIFVQVNTTAVRRIRLQFAAARQIKKVQSTADEPVTKAVHHICSNSRPYLKQSEALWTAHKGLHPPTPALSAVSN